MAAVLEAEKAAPLELENSLLEYDFTEPASIARAPQLAFRSRAAIPPTRRSATWNC